MVDWGSREFTAGIFIGGMEGVEREFPMFSNMHSTTPAFPIASTGAAAVRSFERYVPDRRELLENPFFSFHHERHTTASDLSFNPRQLSSQE